MNKFIENNTKSPMYVAGVMIPPGEGAMVDVPHEEVQALADQAPTLAEQTAILLKDKVATIVESLPNLNDDALDMMTALESAAEKPRKGVVEALANEKIRRADAALKSDPL